MSSQQEDDELQTLIEETFDEQIVIDWVTPQKENTNVSEVLHKLIINKQAVLLGEDQGKCI